MTYLWASITHRRVSLRIGTRSMGIRPSTPPPVLSGWRTALLPFGLVAFYRKDPA